MCSEPVWQAYWCQTKVDKLATTKKSWSASRSSKCLLPWQDRNSEYITQKGNWSKEVYQKGMEFLKQLFFTLALFVTVFENHNHEYTALTFCVHKVCISDHEQRKPPWVAKVLNMSWSDHFRFVKSKPTWLCPEVFKFKAKKVLLYTYSQMPAEGNIYTFIFLRPTCIFFFIFKILILQMKN